MRTRELSPWVKASILAFFLAVAVQLGNCSHARGITVVQNSLPAGTILLLSKSRNVVGEFAASELQSYIRNISGATMPLVSQTVSVTSERLSCSVAILTGPDVANELADPVYLNNLYKSLDQSVISLKDDGFVLKTSGNNILFAGSNDRGTLYAVYEFLRGVGVRFHAPKFYFYQGNAEDVPKIATITFPLVNVAPQPSFHYRALDAGECHSFTREMAIAIVDWMAKNRMNFISFPIDASMTLGLIGWDNFRDALTPEIQKRGIILEVGAHGAYNKFLPRSVYQSAHPEWFPGLKDSVAGCDKSPPSNTFHVTNQDALNTFISNGKRYLSAHPEIAIFSLWPIDGAKWPVSDIDQLDSVPNAPAFVLNSFKAALNGSVEVSGLSYSCYANPPSPRYMYDRTTLIKFAVRRSYKIPISRNQFAELIPAWRKAGYGGPAFIYEYYRRYFWHSLPINLIQLIHDDILDYSSLSAVGISHYCEPADWITYELTHLELAQLLWDKNTNFDNWLGSYLKDRFRLAAPQMDLYFKNVEAAGRILFDQDDYGNLATVSAARDLFIQAKSNLTEAGSSTEAAPVLFLIGLLMKNINYAIADTEISYYTLLGNSRDADTAKSLTKQLVEENRNTGIITRNGYSMGRYDDNTLTWNDLLQYWKEVANCPCLISVPSDQL